MAREMFEKKLVYGQLQYTNSISIIMCTRKYIQWKNYPECSSLNFKFKLI